ncbi:cupin domain-containing protein [Nitrospinota bacterium]
MPFYDLQEMTGVDRPGYSRRVVVGKNLMMLRVEREAGVVNAHSHPNEQIIYLLEGKAKFRLGDEERDIEAGQVIHVPSNLPHRIETLTPVRYLGIYSPPREELIPDEG